MDDDVPMHTVTRFLRLLREINANGPMSVGEMVKATGLPHPTASRMVKSMLFHELVEQEPGTRRFRVAAMALSLSSGFQHANRLAAAARPTIEALTQRIGWPVTVMTRVGTSMVACASTHHLTSLSFGPCPDGTAIPIEHSASGHAFLAYASEAERNGIREGLQRGAPSSSMVSLLVQRPPLESICTDGYATYERNVHTDTPGKTSAISVAILRAGALQGTLTLVFFASAMPMKEAVRRYLRDLQKSAAAIGDALDLGPIGPTVQPSPAGDAERTRASVASAPARFRPTRSNERGRDAASAFSNLVTAEQRQLQGVQGFGTVQHSSC